MHTEHMRKLMCHGVFCGSFSLFQLHALWLRPLNQLVQFGPLCPALQLPRCHVISRCHQKRRLRNKLDHIGTKQRTGLYAVRAKLGLLNDVGHEDLSRLESPTDEKDLSV